jgi:hypothetical protein
MAVVLDDGSGGSVEDGSAFVKAFNFVNDKVTSVVPGITDACAFEFDQSCHL